MGKMFGYESKGLSSDPRATLKSAPMVHIWNFSAGKQRQVDFPQLTDSQSSRDSALRFSEETLSQALMS